MNQDDTVMFEEGGDASTPGAEVVDFSSVDETYQLIPRGKHGVVVDDLTYDMSQRSNNPMWTWVLEVEDGEFAGRKLYFHSVFKGNGLGRTKKTLQRIIPDIAGKPFNPEAIAESGILVGRRFTADVTSRKYEGEMRNNVRDLFPPMESAGGDDFL